MKLEKEDLLKLYRNLVLIRKTDEVMVDGLMQGKIPSFWHSGQGNEAVVAGGTTFLKKGDWVIGGVRGHGAHQAILKGMTPESVYAEHCCKATGCCGGWSGFHTSDLDLGIPGSCGTVGSSFPLATGIGIALKKKDKGDVMVCYFGDGASGRGTLHESFNMAAIMKLPIVWICENNGFAIYMSVTTASASKDIADLAYGYGMPGVVVDGQDVVAVCEAVMSAVEKARAGEGPSLVECKTHRFRPHNEGIPILRGTEPIPEAEIQEWLDRDPIVLFRNKLIERGIFSAAEADKIDQEVVAEMAAMDKAVTACGVADPAVMFKSLYAE
ncbi:MAG: thiamine pyrophosphate-dependent dehydrogenase E1 component subunit alpha [Deltaproteobacteria bacterium]|nr:thiamine pyrophosphate-dependent dehydrogenase E1 component subunit alpha [Deltaproteobacteria bacterium]